MQLNSYFCESVQNHVLDIECHSVVLLNEDVEALSLLVNWVNMLISASSDVISDCLQNRCPVFSRISDARGVRFSGCLSDRFVGSVANVDHGA